MPVLSDELLNNLYIDKLLKKHEGAAGSSALGAHTQPLSLHINSVSLPSGMQSILSAGAIMFGVEVGVTEDEVSTSAGIVEVGG